MMKQPTCQMLLLLLCWSWSIDAFTLSSGGRTTKTITTLSNPQPTFSLSNEKSSATKLFAAGGGSGGKKKRRRKRKKQPEGSSAATTTAAEEEIAPEPAAEPMLTVTEATTTTTPAETSTLPEMPPVEDTVVSEEDRSLIDEIAKFEFKANTNEATATPDLAGISNDETISTDNTAAVQTNDPAAIPLPDIKDTLKRKQLQQELALMEQEAEQKKTKIKRSDRAAFLKLLEQDPYADSDDSLFEKEEYGTVAALLGEGAKPFLGIPFELLQVGHFIGALGIVLMAFVEYPGFPLTNLPTPLRDALAGGLGTVYGINALLAVYVALIQAPSRGQDSAIWGLKTLGVGGLALDQLTQLPTLEQIAEAEARKGARALNKNKTGKPFRG